MEPARNHSRKRDAILAALSATSAHPTAEAVYQAVQQTFPDISLATVYRNLKQFQEEGVVRVVAVVDGMERYDAVTTPHSHFICRSCGCIRDLNGPKLPPEAVHYVQAAGCTAESWSLSFTGLCPACQTHA